MLQAAEIHGVVVENLTGKPLSHASVVLQPLPGTAGERRSIRANARGVFAFDSLALGSYTVRVSRKGFLPSEYGQKRWNSAAAPFAVTGGTGEFISIKLIRYSAITGTVFDDNGVGLAGHEVDAYKKTEPPRYVGAATTDDRGVYRIYGLEPGTYIVRTAGARSEDASLIPTFHEAGASVGQARTVDLLPDQDADQVDIHPLPGNLVSLTVVVRPEIPGGDVTITVASTLYRISRTGLSLELPGLPPDEYDVYARQGTTGAYQRVVLSGRQSVSLVLPQPAMQVVVTDGPPNDSGELWVRARDLAGAGEAFQVPLVNGVGSLPRGRWEVMLRPPDGYYVAGFSGVYSSSSGRPDGWNDLGYSSASLVRGRFSVASGPGAIRGVVRSSGDVVAGVPVYLEGYDANTRTRIGELRTTRTDTRGQYRFDGLSPGTYRILGTFEHDGPDTEKMSAARAQSVTANTRNELVQDLDLYLIR